MLKRAQRGTECSTTTECCGARNRGLVFGPTARLIAHGRPISARPNARSQSEVRGGQRCVTPRQTCPRPNGFGRNLRSKTRWFTGFCNSHQVSHFATFFIDARAEISVAESRFDLSKITQLWRGAPFPGPRQSALVRFYSLAQTAPGFVRPPRSLPADWGRSEAPGPLAPPRLVKRVRGSFCCAGFDNDPSAGSPTETLLRLLLPLNDKVQWTSRYVAGSEPPTSPRSEHFTGPFNR